MAKRAILLLLLAGLTTSLWAAGDFLSLELRETAGQAVVNCPVTLSQYFRDGEVGNDLKVKVNSIAVPSQFDVKSTYPSGYVRHGLVSFFVPTLPANGTATVTYSTVDTVVNNGAPLVAQDFLDDPRCNAVFTMTKAGKTYTASLRQMLAAGGALKYWLRGDLVTELLLSGPAVTASIEADTFINVQFQVRKYRNENRYYISTVVENCWRDRRGTITYNFDLRYDTVSVLARTGQVHYYNARWRKAGWLGTAPPRVAVRHNFNYWIDAGAFLHYDLGFTVPEASLQGLYSNWLGSDHDIMQNGLLSLYMPSSGDRVELGPLPLWGAQYIISQDPRMFDVVYGMGELSGSVPVHLRDEVTRTLVSIDQYPKLHIDLPGISQEDSLPAPLQPLTSPWSVDNAHHPALPYLPYILTGEYYFYEEMAFWANRVLLAQNWLYSRDSEKGLFKGDQVRARAWSLRTLAMFAAVAVDNSWEKAYTQEKLGNNLDYYYDLLVNPATRFNELGFVGTVGHRDDYTASPWTACTKSDAGMFCSPWQEDFVCTSFDLITGLGFHRTQAMAIRNKVAEFAVNRYAGHGFPRVDGSSYQLIVTRRLDTETYFTTVDSCMIYTFGNCAANEYPYTPYALPGRQVQKCLLRTANPLAAQAADNIRFIDSIYAVQRSKPITDPNYTDWVEDARYMFVAGTEVTAKTGETAPIARITILTESALDGTLRQLYTLALQSSGGMAPNVWSVTSGTLPDGLALDTLTGVISGSPIKTGTYAFTVKVTDNSQPALTDTQALQIIVQMPAGGTILQEGLNGYTGCKDTYTRNDESNQWGPYGYNHGAYATFRAGRDGAGKFFRAFVQFDLSALPAGDTLEAATLQLYAVSAAANTLDVYQMLRSWREGTATVFAQRGGLCWSHFDLDTSNTAINKWEVDGADGTNDRAAIATTQLLVDGAGWHDMDVTSLVRNWYNNTTANYGLMLKARDESVVGDIEFNASENSAADKRPRLVLTFKQSPLTIISGAGQSVDGPVRIYPLPTGAQVFFKVQQPGFGTVQLLIYNRNGAVVYAVTQAQSARADVTLQWPGTDLSGRAVQPGIYFYRIIGPGIQTMGKVIKY